MSLYLPHVDDSGFRVNKTGFSLPFHSRDIAYQTFVFKLPLTPKVEQTLYLCFNSGDSMTLAPMKETEGDVLTPDNLATLPTELLARFEDATDRNDLEMVESIINEIRLHNVALANGLAELADMFDYEAILDLIREAQGLQT